MPSVAKYGLADLDKVERRLTGKFQAHNFSKIFVSENHVKNKLSRKQMVYSDTNRKC